MSVAASAMLVPWEQAPPQRSRRPHTSGLLKGRWRDNKPSPHEDWNEPQPLGDCTDRCDGWGTGHFSSGVGVANEFSSTFKPSCTLLLYAAGIRQMA